VKLPSARNFRDLGGHPAADGRRVRRGRVFRCGAPAELDAGDAGRLQALGLRCVIDFRSNEERAREPARWPNGPETRRIEWDYELDRDAYSGLLRSEATPEELDEMMRGFYRRMPSEFAHCYRELFAALLDAHVPLAFHCAAGKDRTGIAAALLLSALGVPRERIYEDYLLSNEQLMRANLRPPGMPHSVFNLVARVDRSWLVAAFDAIETEAGSIDSFIEQRLGVDSRAVEHLRTLYLE
jgi:protein-tyrosine phosphatase